MYWTLQEQAGRVTTAGLTLNRCPAQPDCTARNLTVPRAAGACPTCGGRVFPTDALRIHEEVGELTANEAALSRLMSVLEQLTLVSYIKYLFERQPRTLGQVAFVADGPLALFGPPAGLKRGILAYLRSVSGELRRRGYGLPTICGIEKTGQFAEHAQAISSRLKNGTLVCLPDNYIFERILATRANVYSEYGQETYYGRKFFYRNLTGQVLTITVPCLDEALEAEYSPDDPRRYETLGATLMLLDGLGTKLYEDAVIPIALAHSAAAIPLTMGSRVLTLLSRDQLGRGGA